MIQPLHLTSARLRQAMRIAALVLIGAAALLTGSNVAAQSAAGTACDRVPPSRGQGLEVPDLTGMSVERARQRLRSSRMSPQTIEIPSDAPPGRVVDQWPNPGQRIVDGTVILCVSRGAPDAAIALPDLIHRTEAAARQTLRSARIRNVPTIRNAEHAEAPGEVFDQAPRAGRPVTAATPIVLHVSSGPPAPPPAIPMPELRGLSLDRAVQALTVRRIVNRREIVRVSMPSRRTRSSASRPSRQRRWMPPPRSRSRSRRGQPRRPRRFRCRR
jgi:beta-lactam-binding protein with PASTA domain